MPRPIGSIDLDDDWFLYPRPDDKKWVIIYRPYDISQGPVFDSEAEARNWFYANEAELTKGKGFKHP